MSDPGPGAPGAEHGLNWTQVGLQPRSLGGYNRVVTRKLRLDLPNETVLRSLKDESWDDVTVETTVTSFVHVE